MERLLLGVGNRFGIKIQNINLEVKIKEKGGREKGEREALHLALEPHCTIQSKHNKLRESFS